MSVPPPDTTWQDWVTDRLTQERAIKKGLQDKKQTLQVQYDEVNAAITDVNQVIAELTAIKQGLGG